MLKWVRVDSPTVLMFKSLISEVVTLEKLEYCINGKIHTFQQKRKEPMENLVVIRYTCSIVC